MLYLFVYHYVIAPCKCIWACQAQRWTLGMGHSPWCFTFCQIPACSSMRCWFFSFILLSIIIRKSNIWWNILGLCKCKTPCLWWGTWWWTHGRGLIQYCRLAIGEKQSHVCVVLEIFKWENTWSFFLYMQYLKRWICYFYTTLGRRSQWILLKHIVSF